MDRTIQSGVPQYVGKSTMIIPDTLAATVFYDSAANTIRLAGSLSLKSPYNVDLQFTDSQIVSGSPQSATVKVDFSFAPVMFFDTGTQSLNGGAVEFTPPSIPVAGLYTISFGKQRMVGVFNYPLQFPSCSVQITASTTSLTIAQTQNSYNFRGAGIVTVTANGMNFNLVGGINDGTYGSTWSLGAVTAPV